MILSPTKPSPVFFEVYNNRVGLIFSFAVSFIPGFYLGFLFGGGGEVDPEKRF